MASCSAIGFLQSRSYRQRADGIRSFIDAFHIAKAEIVFKNTPVSDVFGVLEQQATGVAKSFFSCIKSHGSISAADILKLANLNEQERGEIDTVMSVFGRYDSGNQAEIINKSITRLEELHKQADNELGKNGRISSALGLICGIVIAILLL